MLICPNDLCRFNDDGACIRTDVVLVTCDTENDAMGCASYEGAEITKGENSNETGN